MCMCVHVYKHRDKLILKEAHAAGHIYVHVHVEMGGCAAKYLQLM